MDNQVLIIRGAPGVGKSSVAKLLAQYFDEGVTIEIDEIRRMINSVTWTDTQEHLDAIEAAAALVDFYVKKYNPVIVIDTLSQGSINLFTKTVPPEKIHRIVSLTASNNALRQRIIRRNEGFMDHELSYVVNSSIEEEKLDNSIVIDTTNMGISEVFEKIIDVIQK